MERPKARQEAARAPANDVDSIRTWPFAGGLRRRLVLVVAAALLPVAVISILQGLARLDRDRDVVRDRLFDSAIATAGDQQNVFMMAEQVARSISAQPAVMDGGEDCELVLRNTIAGLPYLTNIGVVSAQGRLVCAALPLPERRDVSGAPWWAALWAHDAGFLVKGAQIGDMSKRPILLAALAVRDSEGRPAGAVGVGIDIAWIDQALNQKNLPTGAAIALLDSKGGVIASAGGPWSAGLFGPPSPDAPDLRSAVDSEGREWSYATAALIPGQIYVAYATTDAELFASTYWHFGADLLLPVLTLGLASLAIWMSTEALVTRWLGQLSRVSRAYASGDYAARAGPIESAPDEIRGLARDLDAMATSIEERDRRLRDAVDRQTALVREIHHRVKNNLQIVISLLSLQAGHVADGGARAALEQARMRINALALVHRLLYEVGEIGSVDMRQLAAELCAQMRAAFPSAPSHVELSCESDDFSLISDQAAPATLLAVEAISNAYRHAFPAGRPGRIAFEMRRTPDGASIIVRDDGVGLADLDERAGLRLMRAFAQQLGGRIEVEAPTNGGSAVIARFPIVSAADQGSRPRTVAAAQ